MGLGMVSRLREMIRHEGLVVAPGAYDAITARLAEQAGFTTVYMTGAGTAASLGYPDFGLVTMTEMVQRATTIARSIKVPLIADADTGFGNELNVTRTVQEYERGGVAGIHLEDQVSPKRCGHLDGKEVVPLDEFVAKIRAAAAARLNPDFVIIARTDARAVLGFEDAVRRVNAALANGADIAFLEAAQSLDEVARIPEVVKGPCLLNIVRAGKTPDIDLKQAETWGYKIAILPSLLIGAAVEGCEAVLKSLAETKRPPSSAGGVPIRDRFRRFGSDDWDGLRTKFRVETPEPEELAVSK